MQATPASFPGVQQCSTNISDLAMEWGWTNHSWQGEEGALTCNRCCETDRPWDSWSPRAFHQGVSSGHGLPSTQEHRVLHFSAPDLAAFRMQAGLDISFTGMFVLIHVCISHEEISTSPWKVELKEVYLDAKSFWNLCISFHNTYFLWKGWYTLMHD